MSIISAPPVESKQPSSQLISKGGRARALFDPEIVKIFLQMPDKIWEDLRKEINAQMYRASYSSGAKG